MKKNLYLVRSEMAGIVHQSKNLLLLFLIVVVYDETFSTLFELSELSGLGVGLLELFILMLNNKLNVIAIPMIFIFIMSAFPRCRVDYFGMIRLSKKRWLTGEIFSVLTISFLVVCILFIGTCIFLPRGLEIRGTWGSFMERFALEHGELYLHNEKLILGAEVMTQGTPVEVFLYSAAMMWLYLIMMGLLMIIGTIVGKRMLLFGIAIILTLAGGGALYVDGAFSWFFPLYHVIYGNHFNLFFAGAKFNIGYSIVFFVLVIAGLSIISAVLIKKMNVGDRRD